MKPDDKLNGPLTDCHDNGQKKSEGEFKEGLRQGQWSWWDEEGGIEQQIYFQDDVEHGGATFWQDNGHKASEGEYHQGQRHGPWTYWRQNGQEWIHANYSHGTPHGAWTEWGVDGEKLRETQYVYGIPLDRGWHRPVELVEDKNTTVVSYLFWFLIIAFLGAAFFKEVFLVASIVMFMLAIAIHETGHFTTAKLVGIPIKRFRVGVGPTLFRFVFGNTRYEAGLLPIMGYVEPYQMRPAELAHYSATRRALRRGEPLPSDPAVDPSEEARPTPQLVSRPKRVVFLLGGVTFNYVAAVLLMTVMLHRGSNPGLVESNQLSVARAGVESVKFTSQFTWGLMLFIPQALLDHFRPSKYVHYEPGDLAIISETVRTAGAEPSETETPQKHQLGLWATIAFWLFAINVAMIAFNLLPIPPLDGFGCLRTIVEIVLRRDVPEKYVLPFVVVGVCFLLTLLLSAAFFMARDVGMTLFR